MSCLCHPVVHKVADMAKTVILASSSEIRKNLLAAAGVAFKVRPADVDEAKFRSALAAEGAAAREVAISLAERKARQVSGRYPDMLTIGCDQTLEFGGTVHGKAGSAQEARDFLVTLRGRTHRLYSAAVICDGGSAVWHSCAWADVTLRNFSDKLLDGYIKRGGSRLLSSLGCYRFEEEGVRLVAKLTGDIHAVYGLPLIPILGYLAERGIMES